MKKFIFTAHEILTVIRNVDINVDDFPPTYFEYAQLNEMVNNIENHCVGVLTKYIVIKNPLHVLQWRTAFGELINQVYNELGRSRVALVGRSKPSVELIDRVRLEIEQITDKAGAKWNN